MLLVEVPPEQTQFKGSLRRVWGPCRGECELSFLMRICQLREDRAAGAPAGTDTSAAMEKLPGGGDKEPGEFFF